MGLGEQLDQAAACGELLTQFPAALVPGGLQVLQRDRDGGDVRGYGPAQELVPVVDPDLGQVLHGPLAAAFDLASTGNPPTVLDNLRALLVTELAAITARHQATAGGATDEIAQAGHLPRPSGARELAPDYLRIATTGLYDTARYRSPSEARQAVLARIENGNWPGLSAFYTRYRRPGTRRTGDPGRLA